MIDIDELANQIHADVFDVAKTGIPLGVFPNVFQKIAFEWCSLTILVDYFESYL